MKKPNTILDIKLYDYSILINYIYISKLEIEFGYVPKIPIFDIKNEKKYCLNL
jgi:hypothetical protein